MALEIQPVRRALLDLHRVLLQVQRRESEQISGQAMSPGELLQAATDDLRFSWLREILTLIVELDEARAGEEPEAGVAAALERLRALLVEPDESTGFGRRYLQVLQDHPEAVAAHRAVADAFGR